MTLTAVAKASHYITNRKAPRRIEKQNCSCSSNNIEPQNEGCTPDPQSNLGTRNALLRLPDVDFCGHYNNADVVCVLDQSRDPLASDKVDCARVSNRKYGRGENDQGQLPTNDQSIKRRQRIERNHVEVGTRSRGANAMQPASGTGKPPTLSAVGSTKGRQECRGKTVSEGFSSDGRRKEYQERSGHNQGERSCGWQERGPSEYENQQPRKPGVGQQQASASGCDLREGRHTSKSRNSQQSEISDRGRKDVSKGRIGWGGRSGRRKGCQEWTHHGQGGAAAPVRASANSKGKRKCCRAWAFEEDWLVMWLGSCLLRNGVDGLVGSKVDGFNTRRRPASGPESPRPQLLFALRRKSMRSSQRKRMPQQGRRCSSQRGVPRTRAVTGATSAPVAGNSKALPNPKTSSMRSRRKQGRLTAMADAPAKKEEPVNCLKSGDRRLNVVSKRVDQLERPLQTPQWLQRIQPIRERQAQARASPKPRKEARARLAHSGQQL
ncbi:hypothetical protein DFJ73DRAFT_769274 [Zopfochytrium polystomum]|nr:hypothetical protein DFJ73DRAFT_769274 [Zopfochytrium polystomum]